MTKINFFVVADNAEVRNGKLYIEGIFDSITSYKYPAKHKSLVIAINFEVTPGKHTHSYKIKGGGDNIIEIPIFDFEVSPTKVRHQFVHRINDLPIPNEGKYTIEAYLDGQLIGETYFLAKTIQQPNYA